MTTQCSIPGVTHNSMQYTVRQFIEEIHTPYFYISLE